MSLTQHERHWLRDQINKAQRAKLADERRRTRGNGCAACGAELRNYNLSCYTCRRRKLRDNEPPWAHCHKCGKGILADTNRRRRRCGSPFADVAICYPCSRDHCARCGIHGDGFTRGCVACRTRHHKRRIAVKETEI